MSGNYFGNAAIFLIKTLIELYIGAVLIRVMLQAVRADFYHPICQFIVKITNPLVIPFRRVIPSWRNIDLATLVLAYLLCLLEIILLTAIGGGGVYLLAALVYAIGILLRLVIYIYIILIIVQVILSWVSPYGDNPIAALVFPLTRPVLGPFRRIIPPIGGIDLSPLFALLALQLCIYLVVLPIFDLAQVIALP